MKRAYKALIALFCVIMLAASAYAADGANTLTVSCRHEDTPIPGVLFTAYRIADIADDGSYNVTDAFAAYPVDHADLTEDRIAKVANTLQGYAERDRLTPDASETTDENGEATFNGLKNGLYLILGKRTTVGTTAYTAVPFAVRLNKSGTLTAYPKTEAEIISEEKTSIKVLKSWNDAGNESKRPADITVELLCDGEVSDKVTLSAENKWTHTWEDLDPDHSWNAVEITPRGYKVGQTKEGRTILITNTYDGGKPTEPHEPLPQTGLLWWPVPVLIGAGIILVAAASVRRRRQDR